MRRIGFSLLLCLLSTSALFCATAFAQELKLEDRYADVNGVRLHYVTAGKGKLIIFLHGFPEFWYQWKPQLAEFSKDFQTVAVDMRGYNLSSKPTGVDQYRIKTVVEDVRALAEQLGSKKFILVGHDWGGVIAWAFALYHPDYLEKLIVMNAPHPAIFDRELKENPAQQFACRYLLAMSDPATAQKYAANNYALLTQIVLADGLKSGRFSDEDRKAYLAAWAQPGALDSELAYYRALNVHLRTWDVQTPYVENGNYTPDLQSTVVLVPTLVIWGLRDPFMLAGNLSGIGKFVLNLQVKLLPDASHWVNHEKPNEVNAAMREFFGASDK